MELQEEVAAGKLYHAHVNPQWARLLDVLSMNVRYRRCAGVELHAEDGRRFLDFLSGYCVHNVGHNHPAVIAALHQELDRQGPAMLQSHVAELAGELAERLCRLAGGRLNKVFFCSSGSEGVEAAIKFSRAHTNACIRKIRWRLSRMPPRFFLANLTGCTFFNPNFSSTKRSWSTA